MTEDTFLVWAAAMESGYLPLSAVVLWADEQILVQDRLPQWLLDLSLAPSSDAAVGVLLSTWQNQTESIGDTCLFEELCLGFLFLRYDLGDLTITELLKLAALKSDITGGGIDCSEFYELLDEIEDGGPTTSSLRRMQERFTPFTDVARSRLSDLPSRR